MTMHRISDDFSDLTREEFRALLYGFREVKNRAKARYLKRFRRRAAARRIVPKVTLPWHLKSRLPNGPWAYAGIDRRFAKALREHTGMDQRRNRAESQKAFYTRMRNAPQVITGFGR